MPKQNKDWTRSYVDYYEKMDEKDIDVYRVVTSLGRLGRVPTRLVIQLRSAISRLIKGVK